MKHFAVYLGLATALVVACSIQEKDIKTPQLDDVIYYASFEQPAEEGTRVYANEDLLLRWNADDRISIFGKNTYNQQYKFLGETGDNSGGFSKVDVAEYVTGNPLSHTVSVYPYQSSTKITEDEVVTLTLPSEQHYAENTFGLGANTMVSVSEDNFLQYKNVGGYLMLKLYGDGVSVSSITLKGNNGEKLAGKATVTMPLDGMPSVSMADDSSTEITLVCDTPVSLGSTAEESTEFWFVVPPVEFSKGFSISINKIGGGLFDKATSNSVNIERSKVSKMSLMEVEGNQPNNVIYYLSSDGKIITPNKNASFGANLLTNEYVDGKGVITFDGDVTAIGYMAFYDCKTLTKISIPDSVKGISNSAFHACTALLSINIPEGFTTFGQYSFQNCESLTSINIPESVTSIGAYAFYNCYSLESVSLPTGVRHIYDQTFFNCRSLVAVDLPSELETIGMGAFYGCAFDSFEFPKRVTEVSESVLSSCKNLTSIRFASNAVTTIRNNAFSNCIKLTTIELPDRVSYLGGSVFSGCVSLKSITLPEPVYNLQEWLFYNCSSLETISFGSVVSIKESAFQGCSNLTAIDLSQIYSIGNKAFTNCEKLKVVNLPSTLYSVGYEAFMGCAGLQYVLIAATSIPEISFDVFKQTNDCPIYVPAASVEAYKTAEYWSEYADRIQAIPSVIPVPEAVDMGLPSGLKWASFNLGASKPEEYGDYYAWGETEPYYSSLDPLTWKEGKENGYGWPSYRWCNGSVNTLTKYCNDSSCGYNGFTDDKTVLDPEDDAAHVNLGGNWRMPTYAEGMELIENCIVVWVIKNGVRGLLFTARNGNSIFLPESGSWAGVTYRSVPDNGNYSGYYMTSTLSSKNVRSAMTLILNNEGVHIDGPSRVIGKSIRPVYAE